MLFTAVHFLREILLFIQTVKENDFKLHLIANKRRNQIREIRVTEYIKLPGNKFNFVIK